MSPKVKQLGKILLVTLLLSQSIAAAAHLLASPTEPDPLCLLVDGRLCVDNGCEATGGVCVLVEELDDAKCICVY